MDKIVNWLRSNLIIFVLASIIGAIVSGYFHNKNYEQKLRVLQDKHDKEYQELVVEHNKVITELDKISAETAEKERLVVLNYQQKLEELEQKYQEKFAEIEALRKIKAQEFAKIIKKNPEAAMNEIAKKFGFDIVVVPKD